MGVVDYGVTDIGTDASYSYHAIEFVSWANFTVLNIGNGNQGDNGQMSVQQNLVDYNVYENGLANEYWIQNVPVIYNQSSGRFFLIQAVDNIWNFSSVTGPMGGTLNWGLTHDCDLGSGPDPAQDYYYCQSNQEFLTTLPFEIKMTTSTFTMASGPYSGSSAVKFQIAVYHKNRLVGSITYDEVAFAGSDGGSQPYFYVENGENPAELYNDAETVLCGPGNGEQENITSIAAILSEAYTNATVGLTSIPHAWPYGYDTAETVYGVAMSRTSSTSHTGTATSGTDNTNQLW